MNINAAFNRGVGSRFFLFMKRALLYFARTILVVLGIAQIVSVFLEAFEHSPSFLEISTLEMVFFVALFFMIKNYYVKSVTNRLYWQQILYVLLKNMGWFSVVYVSVFFLVMIMVAGMGKVTDFPGFISAQENNLQLVEYIGVLAIIFLITPKKNSNEGKPDIESASGASGS